MESIRPPLFRTMRQDLSVSAVVAGFVVVLVGFTSSVVIVVQAAAAFGATAGQTASWIWALGIGMGATSLGLSLWLKQPVVTAWSTPGAALLATGAGGVTMEQAVGAFIVSALLITAAGFSGWFERAMKRIRRRWPQRCWPACWRASSSPPSLRWRTTSCWSG